MKARHFFPFLILFVLVGVTTVSADSAPSLNPKPAYESNSPTAVDGRLTGYWLPLGWYWDDSSPAVAYSPISDQYLVVMVEDNPYDNKRNIAGVFVDPTTKRKIEDSDFHITEGAHHMDNPDVVYDSINDRFLVVWEEYDCVDLGYTKHCADVIKGRMIYSSSQNSGSPFAGDEFTVASQINLSATSSDLHDPAVAFNSVGAQFLVIFNQKLVTASDYRDVYGRMVNAHASMPTPLGDGIGFLIANYTTNESFDLDVAWSEAAAATFFAVWEAEKQDGSHYIPGYYLYDTYQGGGIQTIRNWIIAPNNNGGYPLTGDCMTPSVAYDVNTGAYVVVFEYGETVQINGPQGADLSYVQTIYGQRIHRVSKPDTFRFDDQYAFPIETQIDSDNSLHSDPEITSSGAAMEQSLVTYRTSDHNVLADPNDDNVYLYARSLVGDAVFPRFLIRGAPAGNQIWTPAAACQNMNCLLVWQESCVLNCQLNNSFDIHGQLLDGPDTVFFDEAHDEQNTIDAARAQQIVDDQGWGQPDWYYFDDMVTELSPEYLFYRNTNSPLTFEMLDGYGAVMLAVPRVQLTDSEIKALKKYVASGGGLMLLADCGLDSDSIYPGLMDTYDLGFGYFCVSAPGNDFVGDYVASTMANYAILDGVFDFYINWGSYLNLYGDSFWFVGSPSDVWIDYNGNGTYEAGVDATGSSLALVAGYETDCGRVVAVADNAFQDAYYDEGDNALLMRNLLNWVTDGTTCELSNDLFLPLISR